MSYHSIVRSAVVVVLLAEALVAFVGVRARFPSHFLGVDPRR